jgi:hypothetical protein
VPSVLAIRHAVENASQEPITDAGIMAILRGGGVPSHLRAVFGDVSLASILNVGARPPGSRAGPFWTPTARRGTAWPRRTRTSMRR